MRGDRRALKRLGIIVKLSFNGDKVSFLITGPMVHKHAYIYMYMYMYMLLTDIHGQIHTTRRARSGMQHMAPVWWLILP